MWAAAGTVEDVGEQLVGAFQNPGLLLGIPLALAGAVFMSFGAQYQHRGVAKVERISGQNGTAGLTGKQLGKLLTRPSWVLGTIMLGLAIICQLGALSVAPLTVVQPLGAIALVVTTLLNSHVSGLAPTRKSIIAIVSCVGGHLLVRVDRGDLCDRERGHRAAADHDSDHLGCRHGDLGSAVGIAA